MNSGWFIFSIVVCIIIVGTIIGLYSKNLNTDSEQADKLLAIVLGTVISTAVATYAIAAWLFRANPNMLLHFLLFIMLIVIMPMSVIGASLSTVQLNGLRNTVVVSKQ